MIPLPRAVKALLLALPLAAAACAEKRPEGTAAPETAPVPAPEAPAEPVPTPAAKSPAPAAPAAAAPATADVPVGNRPGNLIPAFAATAHTVEGGAIRDESMDSRKTGNVTVWMVSSSTCPVTKRYAPHVVAMETAYQAKGVRFVHVYPNRTESVESKRKFHADKGFRGAWIEDNDASIAKLLGAKKTPEIYLTTADGAIVYRGAIDDSEGDFEAAEKHYLKDALDAVLAGRPVALKETVPAG